MNVTFDKLPDVSKEKPKTQSEWLAARPDMLQYLYEEYLSKLEKEEFELSDEAKSMFQSFIEFSRQQLMTNPVIGLATLEQGLGLRLANYVEIPLVKLPQLEDKLNTSVPITRLFLHPAFSGVMPTTSTPIFGKDQHG